MNKRHFILFFLLLCQQIFSQEVRITGTVMASDDKLPLPGANITIKEFIGKGTTTDLEGKFSLDVPKGKTLLFSFMGYNVIERVIQSSTTLNITLEPNSHLLNEVVAVGYGSVKKSDLTGSVVSIKSDDLKQAPVSGLDQALQGRASGVTITTNSGQPGAASTIRIRGIGTVGNSSPIFVVDGVVVDNINFLNNNDIKSTEVLKDASATAIYGARGANGVIIVTTQKGEISEKMNSTLDVYYGVQQAWRTMDLMNTTQLAKFHGYNSAIDGTLNNWVEQKFASPKGIKPGLNYAGTNTDWQTAVLRDAPIQSYNFSTSGGSKLATYALSTGYFDQQGIVIGSYYKRFTFRVNTSYKVTDWLKVGENLSLLSSSDRNVANNNENYSVLSSALAFAPWDPTEYTAGKYSASSTNNYVNPLSMINNENPSSNWERLVGNGYVEINPIKGLLFRSDVGVDIAYGRNSNFKPSYYISESDKMETNFIQRGMSRSEAITFDNVLSYNRTFAQKHHLSLMAGTSVYQTSGYSIGGSSFNITNPIPENWYIGQGTGDRTVSDNAWRNRMFSLFGRVHYVFNDRYLMTVNIRRDGSSKFPKDKLYGVFPSAALGWRVSEEAFFAPAKEAVSSLKLRLGWGQIGNDKIDGNQAIAVMEQPGPWFVGYVLGQNQTVVPGASLLRIPAESLKWETSEQSNIGVDFTIGRSLLTGTIDIYRKDTKDMLLPVVLPGHFGAMYSSFGNVGSVRNDGFEISLEHRKKIGDINYSVGGNFSMVKNTFTELGPGTPLYSEVFNGQNLVIANKGLPLWSYVGYKTGGVFQSKDEINDYFWTDPVSGKPNKIQPDAKVGDVKYLDLNNDGKIDNNDITNLGNSFPKFTYGLNGAIDYKGFDLQLFFQGVVGNQIYNATKFYLEGNGTTNLLASMDGLWYDAANNGQYERTSNTIPNPNSVNFQKNTLASDRFLESGSYLRLKNAQVGYTLPNKLTQKAKISKLRVYLSGSNLFTITQYSGFDPEVGSGVDRGNYPQARTFILGATCNF